MSVSSPTDFYLNFQQFGDMKLRARNDSADAAKTVAQQFEGLFVQQMLAAMRSASKLEGGQDSSYMDFYQEMYDKQLAQTIAGQNKLGVARMIVRQMPGDENVVTPEASGAGFETFTTQPVAESFAVDMDTITTTAAPAVAIPVANASEPVPVRPEAPVVSNIVASPVLANDFAEIEHNQQANSHWQTPHDFVADIWPQALSVASKLGVSPALLVAQSALETGWGKHMMKFDDGRSSNNLFGIKADSGWQGNSVKRASLEFSDGSLKSQVSSFRAYATAQQSLDDYADFIVSNPRYEQALKSSGDDSAYIHTIQAAGYATDPRYADKVLNIMNGEILQQSLASLDPASPNLASLDPGVADNA